MKPEPWLDKTVADNGLRVMDNFLAWFGKSKIVDAQKRPMQLFHGTHHDFEAFDPDRCRKIAQTGAMPRAMFFSTSPEVAASYAGQRTPDTHARLPTEALYEQWLDLLKKHGPGGATLAFHEQHEVPNVVTYAAGAQVIPVYLKVERLLNINARGEAWNNIHWRGDDWDTNHLIAHARDQGYDGVFVRNVHDRAEGKGASSDVCAIFRADQVKSAIGNSGLYAPNGSLTDAPAPLVLRQSKKAQDCLSAPRSGLRLR